MSTKLAFGVVQCRKCLTHLVVMFKDDRDSLAASLYVTCNYSKVKISNILDGTKWNSVHCQHGIVV